MDYTDSSLLIDTASLVPGAIRWRSPSNIAIVKYWGKHGQQLPQNPSLSFTLSSAATDTTLYYQPQTNQTPGISVELYLDGERRPDFEKRTVAYFESLVPIYPFLRQLDIRIETSNSFPHSAGIASSASGMSALALCLVGLETRFFSPPANATERLRKASYLARLGSGSACRSVYPSAAVWGQTGALAGSSDEVAVPVEELLHDRFRHFHDDILLISKSEKSVSSRAGHGLMDGNPYAAARYRQAEIRTADLLAILRAGDVERFGEIAESEALTLHALMMASQPPYLLLEPNTLTVIRKIQQFRMDTGHPVYFTLDAGPNIHLLYPHDVAAPVRDFVRGQLLEFCTDGQYIADRMGAGPEELEVSS
jgi:diphosphomevalonate decarboxylase